MLYSLYSLDVPALLIKNYLRHGLFEEVISYNRKKQSYEESYQVLRNMSVYLNRYGATQILFNLRKSTYFAIIS